MSSTITTKQQQQRAQRGVNRVLTKLEESIESGDFYEAHQMYRTLYFRYSSQGKYDECLQLLNSGAQKLISKNQDTSAADLSLLLVDTLEEYGSKVNDNNVKDFDLWMERLSSIIAQLSSSTVERETLIQRALKWSGDASGNPMGHPYLHKSIAHVFWNENNFDQARHHYLLCRDSNLCGRVLVKISLTKGYPSETELFIAQAVLQQLCLKEATAAECTFNSYCACHPKIKRNKPPYKKPLLNFLHLLFQTIELGRSNLNTFRALCRLYKPSLSRDVAFEKYLSKIGVIYFGAAPPNPFGDGFLGGMFGDFVSRLLTDGEDDDDSNNDPSSGNQNRSSNNHVYRSTELD